MKEIEGRGGFWGVWRRLRGEIEEWGGLWELRNFRIEEGGNLGELGGFGGGRRN